MKGTPSLNLRLEPLVGQVQKLCRSGQALGGVQGSMAAALAAWLFAQSGKDLLLLLPDYEAALELAEDLAFFLDTDKIRFFPHYDSIPYDPQSPDKSVLARRLSALGSLTSGIKGITVTTSQALSQRLLPPKVLKEAILELKRGELYERSDLAQRLVSLGYQRVEQVEDKGEFALRGEILDLFAIQYETPFRLDFFDIELESIKTFDPQTQASIAAVDSLLLLPAQEVVYSSKTREHALLEIKNYREATDPAEFGRILEAIEAQEPFSGIENLLPLFYESPAGLFDYLSPEALVLVFEPDETRSKAENHFNELAQEYEYSRAQGLPTLEPERLYWSEKRLIEEIGKRSPLYCQAQVTEGGPSLDSLGNSNLPALAAEPEWARMTPTRKILQLLKKWHTEGAKVLVASESATHAAHLAELLAELELGITTQLDWGPNEHWGYLNQLIKPENPSFVITKAHLNQGFRLVGPLGQTQLILINDEEIFGPKQKKRSAKGANLKAIFSSLEDLQVGDHVVHVEYGIGRYEGLHRIEAGGKGEDFLVLSYAGGDKVYVPIEKFGLIQKFTGNEGASAPRVNKLGDKVWVKTKSKVKEEIDDIAEELVALYARRKARQGISFSPDGPLAHEFALGFAYNETEDQLRAIEEVSKDMESESPMDRLVCGDVGFGKTEVAMRACMKAVLDGYQVGFLVPTTILAQQHYETFIERFKNFPIRMGLASRFQNPKTLKNSLKDLAEGKLDIMIGTHRLLSKDVTFKNLGLLVIDEEQRFGVKHKEQIKAFKSQVDCLALSATPIPRTLHMSLVGIRDITVINTAPMDRRAIRTRLMKFSEYVISEAVGRELRRGGQVFFIHNRVESIHEIGTLLQSIMPKVKIGIAHGQMNEHELEEVMHGFTQKHYDLLLATAIVESGLDIPNANTIIVNNADQFGLSQLYQIRGRVGRSKAQAYAYFLTPKEKLLSDLARKRLSILSELNHLGAGFKIASYDLELRGAGNLLGSNQSGHIQAVGFDLYTQMIEEAISKLRGEPIITDHKEIQIHLGLEASLPESYIQGMNQRLEAYKKIAQVADEAGLWELRANLEDRFGPLPKTGINLFLSMQFRLVAARLEILRLEYKDSRLGLTFGPKFSPDPKGLVELMKEMPLRPSPDGRLMVQVEGGLDKALVLLKQLEPKLTLLCQPA